MRILAIIFLAIFSAQISLAQSAPQDTIPFDNDSSFDVSYVKFDLSVRPDTEYIAGSVDLLSRANALRPDSTIQLSLRGQLSVDSLFDNGRPATFHHTGDKLFVTLNQWRTPGQTFDLHIYYHGYSTEPDRVGFIHTWQNWERTGIPISWSWGEPFGMKDWWPCKDNPADKLDSADLNFTCPKPYMVASNGTLIHVTDNDSSQTFHWHESYPIDHYLIAFVCTQFDTLVHWHHWADGDSTKIMHFIFPGSVDTLGPQLDIIDTILNVYERWFGPYAFRKEKYGIAQWHGGGMENETLSFCNDADTGILAHETAHQWFGDAVTCKTWNDCWLNEGFATYVADLFFRYRYGQANFDSSIASTENTVTSEPSGSVHIPDSILVDNVLNYRLVYCKGALLLNMLRFVLGSDSAFFRCLREYDNGRLRYGVAGAEDFRASVDKSSGRDLDWFFNEWVYGDGYPIYSIGWDPHDGKHPSLAIEQTGSAPESPLFTMPIEIEFIGPRIDTTVEVWNDAPLESYSFSFPDTVTRMVFDPHNWLLDGSMPRTLAVSPGPTATSTDFRVNKLLSGYEADFSTDESESASIYVYDILGRQVAEVALGVLATGSHSIPLNLSLSDGTYFCRIVSTPSNNAMAKISIIN